MANGNSRLTIGHWPLVIKFSCALNARKYSPAKGQMQDRA